MVFRLPFILVICFIALFVYLGLSFLGGVGIFIITFFTNLCLSRITAKLQKDFMKKQDARVKAVTESLGNIKTLKMYSWTNIFKKLI